MKKAKWKHPAPLICLINDKILGKHSPSKMLFGTGCKLHQQSRKQCADCKCNVRQQQWEKEHAYIST